MARYRVQRTARATLSRTFYLDEVPTDATGSVLVTIARQDGTVVQGPTAATGPTSNVYSFVFSGSDTLDNLTVTWSATVGGDAVVLDEDFIEVVGGFYFSLAEARAIDPKFADTGRFTTDDIKAKRIEVEDECERITGRAWVPRFQRDILSGSGQNILVLSKTMLRRVRSITVDGALMDSGTVALFGGDRLGALRFSQNVQASASAPGWAYGSGNIIVEYEHGHDRPEPPVVRGAKLRMKSFLLTTQSPMMDRAERVMTVDQSGGTVTYGSPSEDRTGIPETDAAYGKFPHPRPGFG